MPLSLSRSLAQSIAWTLISDNRRRVPRPPSLDCSGCRSSRLLTSLMDIGIRVASAMSSILLRVSHACRREEDDGDGGGSRDRESS